MHSSQHGYHFPPSETPRPLHPSSVSPQPLGQPSNKNGPTVARPDPSSPYMPPADHQGEADEPEPLTETELHAIQARLQELGLISKAPDTSSTLSPRENELLHMTLRLSTHASTLPDPSQLITQAETIVGLTHQRNYLLSERTEEQKRWEAEREGFDRIAEALIIKRNAAASNRALDDETQRHISRLEDDNEALKRKLSDTQQRMSALESDLNRLRPLLLAQTIVSRTHPFPSSAKPSRRRKPTDTTSQPRTGDDVEMISGQATDVLADTDINSSLASSSSRPKSHYRFGEAEPSQTPSRRGKKTSTSTSQDAEGLRFKPILADARSEMLLSAAKKLGRTKTGLLTGVIRSSTSDGKQDKEKDKETEDRKRKPTGKGKQKASSTPGPSGSTSTSTTRRAQPITNLNAPSPRTPRHTTAVPNPNSTSTNTSSTSRPTHFHPSATISHPEFVYINPGAVPPVALPMPVIMPLPPTTTSTQTVPAWSTSLMTHATPTSNRTQHETPHHLRTPTSNTRTPSHRNRVPDDETQGTPFNSLLSAARSIIREGVFDDYDEDARSEGATTPRANVVDPYTPTRPRRRADPSESPLAKRRKVEASSTPARSQGVSSVVSTPKSGKGPPTRVRSALDVLADQAAQEQERRPSVDSGSQRPSTEPDIPDSTHGSNNNKGKGKVTERDSGRPPSAPPPSNAFLETTLIDLRNGGQNGGDTEEEVPTRPSTPPTRLTRAISEEPSPSRRLRVVPGNPNGRRKELGTPRKIAVIPITSSSTATEQKTSR